MNYKAIFLSALVMPFAIMSNNDATVCIQELKIAESKTAQELSSMSKIIEEKELLIESMMATAIAVAVKKYTSSDEKIKFQKEITAFGERLDAAIATGNIKNLFLKEIFDDAYDSEVGRIRSILIRRCAEQIILQKLVKLYEEAVQKYLEINLKLENLEKQVLDN